MAKTTLHISIPEPCHEDWSAMTPTQCGAFCNSCQKDVVDFSQMSEAEIVDILSRANGKVCGRIPSNKLNRELVKYEPDAAWYNWKKWAVAAGVLLGVSNAKANNIFANDTTLKRKVLDSVLPWPQLQGKALNMPDDTASPFLSLDSISHANVSDTPYIILLGKISDGYGPLASANIILDASKGLRTLTDDAGNYRIQIPANLYHHTFSCKVYSLGYEAIEFAWMADKSETKDFVLSESAADMIGEVVITGKPAVKYKLLNFFRRIAYAFRKPASK